MSWVKRAPCQCVCEQVPPVWYASSRIGAKLCFQLLCSRFGHPNIRYAWSHRLISPRDVKACAMASAREGAASTPAYGAAAARQRRQLLQRKPIAAAPHPSNLAIWRTKNADNQQKKRCNDPFHGRARSRERAFRTVVEVGTCRGGLRVNKYCSTFC